MTSVTLSTALSPAFHLPGLEFDALMPQINLTGNELYCDGRAVDLFGRRLTIELIRLFLKSGNLLLGRDDIVQGIYQVDPRRLSKAFLHSRRACVLKLIARSRDIIHAGLKDSPGEDIEWFFYHVDTREYELYRIRNSYPILKQQFIAAV